MGLTTGSVAMQSVMQQQVTGVPQQTALAQQALSKPTFPALSAAASSLAPVDYAAQGFQVEDEHMSRVQGMIGMLQPSMSNFEMA